MSCTLFSKLLFNLILQLLYLECEKLHKKPIGVQNTEIYNVKNTIIHSTQPRKISVVRVTCTNTKRKTEPLQRIPKGYTHNLCHGKFELEKKNNLIKDYSKKNLFYHTVIFDLQVVLHCPCSNVSQVNLSVYSLGNAEATCFIWNKIECNRG